MFSPAVQDYCNGLRKQLSSFLVVKDIGSKPEILVASVSGLNPTWTKYVILSSHLLILYKGHNFINVAGFLSACTGPALIMN